MGFLGGLLDSFTGKGARKDIDKGIAAVNENTGKGVDAYKSYGDQAQGYLQPYRDQGGSAFRMYGDTLGVNGTGARDVAQQTYLSDPILQKQLELQQRQRGWASNSRGGYGSGADALAASRVNLQGYGNWQNMLGGLGQQGQAAAGTSAGLAQQTGSGVAGTYGQSSATLAGLYGNRAQTQNALAQNIIGGIGAVGTFFGGKPAPQGTGQVYGGNNLGGQPMSQVDFDRIYNQTPQDSRYGGYDPR